ncbi:MAG: OmpA family protein [Myxococcaceae bacterium]|nr:OmpA family protein [Myxococcaceae bacterium]
MSRAGAALVWLLTTSVMGQEAVPGFELERLRFNPGARAGLLVDSADLLEPLGLRVGLTGHYQHDPLVVVNQRNERLASAVRSRLGVHLTGAFGITRWLEVGLQLPVVLWQAGDDLGAVGFTRISGAAALGTPWLHLRAAPLQQARGAPLDVSVGLGVGFPFGADASLTRDPTLSVAPVVAAGRTFSPGARPDFLRVGGSLSVLVRGARQLTTSATVRDEVGSSFSAGLMVSTLGTGLRGELSGRLDVPFTRSPLAGELMVGVRSPRLGPIELSAVGGPGFGQQPGTPSFRVLAGVALVAPLQVERPRPVVDRCAAEPPPADCPRADEDGDGVANADDRCPTVMGLRSLAGCPDTDVDGDGVFASGDACPDQPGTSARRGCPAPDGDGDGVDDDVDRCPTVPGTLAFSGCPDTDGDGFEDSVDACPAEAGVAPMRGCPDADQDGDGVVDRFDACRTVKGTPANEGCPAAERQLVVITRERLIIRDKVYFASGKSVVLPRSALLLAQLARVLKEHPEIERVSIEGHTDSQGERQMNLRLSEARAAAVRDALVRAGVASERIASRGFGPDQPVQPNATAAGREANRRVEFVIIGAEHGGLPGP